MNKKAVELSLNTIIIAIIVIIVLVVVVFIFSQRASIFGRSLEGPNCLERGGVCKEKNQQCSEDRYVIYTKGCLKDGGGSGQEDEVGPCCVPIERPKE